MDQMLLRRRCVEEATEGYPMTRVVNEAGLPVDNLIQTANDRSQRSRTAFEHGAQWASRVPKQSPRIPLADFNAASSDQSALEYRPGQQDQHPGDLVSRRMAFRTGAAWSRTYIQGLTDAKPSSPLSDAASVSPINHWRV